MADEDWGSYLAGAQTALAARGACATGSAKNMDFRRRSWAAPMAPEDLPPPLPLSLLPALHELHGGAAASPHTWNRQHMGGSASSSAGGSAEDVCQGGGDGAEDWMDYRMSPHRGGSGAFGCVEGDDDALPSDDWEEDAYYDIEAYEGRQQRVAAMRRQSCDSYSYEEIEAARMRIKRAAWEVVNAQQTIDQQNIASIQQKQQQQQQHQQKGSTRFGSSRNQASLPPLPLASPSDPAAPTRAKRTWGIKKWFTAVASKG
eukprot:TRINITY_DN44838_c0_g1_i1.p1 TRINITY_DN44838_c0_g1~~TRINITY_DN44838_c0_g1_i1.p1  ORF type:complete len:259 (+),score=-5.56 TRINITY_DN44838_c0_g1_i1:60-836(+)